MGKLIEKMILDVFSDRVITHAIPPKKDGVGDRLASLNALYNWCENDPTVLLLGADGSTPEESAIQSSAAYAIRNDKKELHAATFSAGKCLSTDANYRC